MYEKLTCIPLSFRCSLTQFRKVFACISTHKSSLPRMFMPLAAVPSGLRATRPACVIFCNSVLPSELCCNRPACVTRASLMSRRSIVSTRLFPQLSLFNSLYFLNHFLHFSFSHFFSIG